MQILDRALLGYDRSDLDFAFDFDDLHPPHPFSELLRQAFAPHLDPLVLLASTLATEVNDLEETPQVTKVRIEWHAAIMQFADRYQIWEPDLALDDATASAA